MIEAEDTLTLISALEAGAPKSRIEELLDGPVLRHMFPAVGIPLDLGLRYLEAVRSPARPEGLDETENMVVGYLTELIRSRQQIERLLQELSSNEPTLVAEAFEKTRQLLPRSCGLGDVRLVLLPIAYDFRTDRETVYMDPLAAVQYGPKGIRHSLSHEFHHIARYRLTGENLTLMRPEETPPFRNLLDVVRDWAAWLELEGIADCVSNVTQFEIPALRGGIQARRRQMAGYGELLEGGLAAVRVAEGQGESTSDELNALRMELLSLVHPVGARLAEYILTDLGQTALVESVGHPDLFLQQYNTVARAKGLVPFDQRMIEWTRGE